MLSTIGLYGSHDGHHQPEDTNNRQQDGANNHEGEQEGDKTCDGNSDIEIQRFLALIVHEGTIVFFNQPDHQWPQNIAERKYHTDKGQQVACQTEAPLFLLRQTIAVIFFAHSKVPC